MRQIKFRAWSVEEKRMISLADAMNCEFVTVQDENTLRSEFESIILMQFTGLIDKNGKEIYEGDLVNVWSDGEDDYNETKEVVWSESLLQWQWGESGRNHCALYELENNFLVVGNIYENKDLLK